MTVAVLRASGSEPTALRRAHADLVASTARRVQEPLPEPDFLAFDGDQVIGRVFQIKATATGAVALVPDGRRARDSRLHARCVE
jgi:hypothetical protein